MLQSVAADQHSGVAFGGIGCHDTFKNWWQTIPEDHSVTGEEYIGMKTTVFVSIG